MNKNFMQIDDNFGVVSDEKGNISLVRSENNEVQLEDILNKENELEYLSDKYKSKQLELEIIKENIGMSNVLNIASLAGGVYIYSLGVATNPVYVSLLVGVGVYALFNIISIGASHGTIISHYKKRKKLLIELEELEEQIPVVNKELEDIKDKAVYKVEDISDVRDMNNTLSEDYIKDISKVKVRRLVRNNDKNR